MHIGWLVGGGSSCVEALPRPHSFEKRCVTIRTDFNGLLTRFKCYIASSTHDYGHHQDTYEGVAALICVQFFNNEDMPFPITRTDFHKPLSASKHHIGRATYD